MKKQAFGLVSQTFPEYKGTFHPISVGSIVEIALDERGLRGLIVNSSDFIPIWFRGEKYFWKKTWFSDFWIT